MFDFERLDVYQVTKNQNIKIITFLNSTEIDPDMKDRWKKASLSTMLNLAEGTGRMTVEEKKHYYTLARGSVFECTAIMDLLHDMGQVDNTFFEEAYQGYEQISKMLLAMYRSMDRQKT